MKEKNLVIHVSVSPAGEAVQSLVLRSFSLYLRRRLAEDGGLASSMPP